MTLRVPMKQNTPHGGSKKSFVERLREVREAEPRPDLWRSQLANIRFDIGHDGVARVATDRVFDLMDIPPLKRTPEAARRLRLVMLDLGWTPVRARHVTSRGRAARVRGYARVIEGSRRSQLDRDSGPITPSEPREGE
jgi:hypothetical protein